MALPNEIHPFHLAGAGQGYQVSNSLRFRASASAYLSRTFGTPTNGKKYTFSFWVKFGKTSGDVGLYNTGGSGATGTWLYLNSSSQLNFNDYCNGNRCQLVTTQVFRDSSAWYHVVAVLDTTVPAMYLYINGVRVTAFGTNTTPTLNANSSINYSGAVTNIGRLTDPGSYHDGYITEFNFIDGQALDPSYFGQTDTVTGIWGPKQYVGTYGTNGFYLPFNTPVTSSYGGSFNGSSQYLQATLPATLSGAFTIEYFLYRGSSGNQFMFTLGDSANSTGFECYIGSTGTVLNALWGGSSKITATGSTSVIPTSTWSHIALTRDASNNVRMFLNGAQVGSTVSNTNAIDTTLRIGVEYFSAGILGYLNGSLSNFRIINGTCLYTSNFNVPAQALTALSGTSILTLQSATVVDNSSNALSITNNGTVTMSAATPWTNFLAGQDSSGNGNGWSSSGISITSGVTYDSMIDSPTNYNDGGNNRGNYCTLNPLVNAGSTISNANLTVTAGTGYDVVGTISPNFKCYFEMQLPSAAANSPRIGMGDVSVYNPWVNNVGTGVTGGFTVIGSTGKVYVNGVNTATYATFTTNDIVGFAFDPATANFWYRVNGTWANSGNPAAGTGYVGTGTIGLTYVPVFSVFSSTAINVNFGQRPFTYTPPAGFLALNTYNLANPSLPLV